MSKTKRYDPIETPLRVNRGMTRKGYKRIMHDRNIRIAAGETLSQGVMRDVHLTQLAQ